MFQAKRIISRRVTLMAFRPPPGVRLKSEPARPDVLGFNEATSNSGCCAKQSDAKTRERIIRIEISYRQLAPVLQALNVSRPPAYGKRRHRACERDSGDTTQSRF